MLAPVNLSPRVLSQLGKVVQCIRLGNTTSSGDKFVKPTKHPIEPVEMQEVFYSNVGITLKAQSLMVLNSYVKFAKMAAKCLKLDVSREIFLNTEVREWVILKSPFKYKKHMVKYRLKTHGRMLVFKKMTGTTTDIYLEYIQRNIPAGMSMSVRRYELDRLPYLITKSVMQNRSLEDVKVEDDEQRANEASGQQDEPRRNKKR